MAAWQGPGLQAERLIRALHVLRAQGGAAAETRPRRRLEGRDKNGGGYVSRWQVRRGQAAGMAEMRCQVRRRRRRRGGEDRCLGRETGQARNKP
jgi:hypothetical protein